MKTSYLNCCSIAATSLAIFFASNVSADIITDLASATIIEDFQFGDVAGTQYDAAANSANPGNLLSTDTTPAELAGVNTDGLGNLNASLKNNTAFGTTLVDTNDLTSGIVYGVIELTWDFTSTLDPAENEEIRISLINSGISSVLAEFEIQREDDDTVTILGNGVGTGSSDISSVVLNGGSLTQSAKFIGVVESDLDADTYSVHFSTDAGASFTTLGSGTTDPNRSLDKLRLTMNNDLVGDNILIDRVYLARAVPEPSAFLLLCLGSTLVATRRSIRK